jgi:hypothetical protein
MTRGGHGVPKVSRGPPIGAMPDPSTPYVQAILNPININTGGGGGGVKLPAPFFLAVLYYLN